MSDDTRVLACCAVSTIETPSFACDHGPGRIYPRLEMMRPDLRPTARGTGSGRPGSRLGRRLPGWVGEVSGRDEGYGVSALGRDHP